MRTLTVATLCAIGLLAALWVVPDARPFDLGIIIRDPIVLRQVQRIISGLIVGWQGDPPAPASSRDHDTVSTPVERVDAEEAKRPVLASAPSFHSPAASPATISKAAGPLAGMRQIQRRSIDALGPLDARHPTTPSTTSSTTSKNPAPTEGSRLPEDADETHGQAASAGPRQVVENLETPQVPPVDVSRVDHNRPGQDQRNGRDDDERRREEARRHEEARRREEERRRDGEHDKPRGGK